MNPEVDEFIKKAKQWREEMENLRAILLGTKLEEGFKWGKPCYTSEGNNVAIIQPFKKCLGLMFFKGTLLTDPEGLLRDNGPNSQSARRLEFTGVREIASSKTFLKAYVKEAIEIEKAGRKVESRKEPEPRPHELEDFFKREPELRKAFESLTPGRQRAYILHFASAKTSATRVSRIEKCIPRILERKGLNER